MEYYASIVVALLILLMTSSTMNKITTTLNMFPNELSKILYDQLGWNMFEIELKFT